MTVEDNTLTDLLVSTAFKSLDLQSALSQPQPTFKVRHLKSGLKFTLALLEARGHAAEPILDKGLHSKLVQLFDKPHMSVSLKVRNMTQSPFPVGTILIIGPKGRVIFRNKNYQYEPLTTVKCQDLMQNIECVNKWPSNIFQ